MEVSVSSVTNTVAYDSLGRQISNTDGRGNTRRTEYNALGQHSASIDALGNRTTYAYDQFGNLASVTDPLGNVTIYEYDLHGRKTYEGGATYPVRYTYDIFGNKTTMMTYRNESLGPDSGDVTTWLYDIASGSMTNKVYADGKGPTYAYTPDGKLAQRTWARGIVTDYSYDNWGSLVNVVYSDGTPMVSIAYDVFGRKTAAYDAAGVTTLYYDFFGTLTNETVIGVAGTNTIERFYDTFGRNAGYALNGVRQTTLSYDPGTGRFAAMLVAGVDAAFSWNFSAGSDLKSSLEYPNGVVAFWTYDAKGQLLEICNATATNKISQYNYVYDFAGRREQIGCSGLAMLENRTDYYGYNARNEVTNVTKNASFTEYAYSYDDVGNRLTSYDLGANRIYASNSLNQYTVISNVITESSSSQVETFAPQFDLDGNQTMIQTETGIWSVTYNGENRPVLWTCLQSNNQAITNQIKISMSYDRMGRRVVKDNQFFVYDGYLQIANFEQSVTNTQLFIWDPTVKVATRPLVRISGTSVMFYAHDGNKNVSEIIASDGALVAHYEYSPFGAATFCCGELALANPWRFSSEYADNQLGLLYYNYRYFEPVVMRWIIRDKVEALSLLNLYLYSKNTMTPDWLGLFTFDDFNGSPPDGSPWSAMTAWTLEGHCNGFETKTQQHSGDHCKSALKVRLDKKSRKYVTYECPCTECWSAQARCSDFQLTVSLDTDNSWVKDSARSSSDLLAHENLHLLIAKKEAEKEARKVQEIWKSCGLFCSKKWAEYYAKEAIRNSTESFVNSANDNIMSVQNQYDEETDHGRNSSKQDEWGNKDEYK